MNNFETIIGIEIHLELNTKTKMFSPAANDTSALPNSNVHPIDIGYPGTLPRVNKEAIIKAIQLAKALEMEIDPEVRFDRKNYFYPDLPKGYQITQQFFPIGKNGKIEIDVNGNKKTISIQRIHMEEDTAKQSINGNKIYYDFNRSGVPLIEIVTDPVIKSADEAIAYVEAIRKYALALNISNAVMAEGNLRVDVNISIRPYGYEEYGTRVEIKNMNSFSNIKKAIEAEIKHQVAAYISGQEVHLVTKRFDESTNDVITMRAKTVEIDYRYFREPNIPTIILKNDFIESIKINELPHTKVSRYKSYGLNEIQYSLLVNDLKLADYFDSIKVDDLDKSKLANLFFSEIVSLANKNNIHPVDLKINPNVLAQIMQKLNQEEISNKHVKFIIPQLFETNLELEEIIEKNNYKLITDKEFIKNELSLILKENEQVLKDLETRPERVFKTIMGQLMKKTNAQVSPKISNEILESLLNKEN
ncbi:aspartyl/glutamyl-tRNA(Asn/Gln) amidotransferase subunit B [Mycoplasma testudineum]|uniref:Aspartyl/glutamyl-tRNA(Asn/Gln) amidotransferase subunit B n=1 Tax=Mycoplasma testudineum TaxID=244584 RepID=A0A4R6IHB3_9MOLU|nr:Asp-tRNA(Asn)/Glu-tRNA(Gln) amidotransferase subunit GatB [Mycoplasma testudineum]OYD26897.1 Asp-tRNA(Asn)/Glu-tRNA(Gln) amidotransferase GatCAB subunit B [Mycoplasma testudineum]TDO20445.1 aspartyl/glutamyl-tRNA(Asn/Gln) amidotransferase subunit B [Mycoplasma testudineum]